MAAFSAADPKFEEIVGSIGPFVYGVAPIGTALDLSRYFTVLQGAVACDTAGANATSTNVTAPATLNLVGNGTDLCCYIAWGIARR